MSSTQPTSLEIAQAARLRPIEEIAGGLGLAPGEWEPYGRAKAKIDLSVIDRRPDAPRAKLVGVTAITPTKAGEGKTATAVSRSPRGSGAGRCSACARPRSAPCSA